MTAPPALQRLAAHPWALPALGALVAVVGAALVGARGRDVSLAALALLPALCAPLLPVVSATVVAWWVPVQYFVSGETHGFGPRALIWLDELCLIALGGSLLWRAVSDRRPLRPGTLEPWLLAFVGVGVLSAILNRTGALPTILGLRSIAQYALFYLAVLHLPALDRERLHGFWRASLVLAVCNLPVSVAQFALRYSSATNPDDIAPGLIDSSNNTSMYLVPFLAAATLVTTTARRAVLLGAALALPFLLGQGRFAILLLPVYLAWLHSDGRGAARLKGLAVAGGIAAVLAAGVGVYFTFARDGVLEAYSPKTLLDDQLRMETGGGRLMFYPLAWRVLQEDAAWLPLGTGPATFTSYPGYRLQPYRVRWLDDIFHQSDWGYDTAVDSQLVATGVEYGPLGLLLFYGALWAGYRAGTQLRRRSRDPTERRIGIACQASALVMATGTLVGNVWETQTIAFYFWFLSAASLRLTRALDATDGADGGHDAPGAPAAEAPSTAARADAGLAAAPDGATA